MTAVAYNADDPVQTSFLSAIAQSETVGGGSSTNSSGWLTALTETPTWQDIATQYNLNFGNTSDQAAGVWYTAQQADPNLESQLQAGNYSAVQSALASVWPSVTGSQGTPSGLAAALAALTNTATSTAASTGTGTATSYDQGVPNPAGAPTGSSSSGLGTLLQRWGLIAVGVVIVFVALWWLMSTTGYVPSPQKVARNVF